MFLIVLESICFPIFYICLFLPSVSSKVQEGPQEHLIFLHQSYPCPCNGHSGTIPAFTLATSEHPSRTILVRKSTSLSLKVPSGCFGLYHYLEVGKVMGRSSRAQGCTLIAFCAPGEVLVSSAWVGTLSVSNQDLHRAVVASLCSCKVTCHPRLLWEGESKRNLRFASSNNLSHRQWDLQRTLWRLSRLLIQVDVDHGLSSSFVHLHNPTACPIVQSHCHLILAHKFHSCQSLHSDLRERLD